MAIGPDRVQVIKQESGDLGGNPAETVPYDTPIEPQEDALESAGLYLQDENNRDEEVYVARDGDDMVFRDRRPLNSSTVTLTQLRSSAVPVPTAIGQILFAAEGLFFGVHMPLTSMDGWLIDDDGIHLVIG